MGLWSGSRSSTTAGRSRSARPPRFEAIRQCEPRISAPERELLEIRDLAVRYGRITAVHGVSLDVGEGEIVGLVGPNGAGKSTTLAAILGLVPVASGEISYLGESLVGVSTDAIARRGIALVLEGRHIFGTLTVAENLLLGRTANPDRRRADAVLERELERFPDPAGDARSARRARSREASSSSWRSPARCSRSRGCYCSTSRRSALRRCSSIACSRRSPRSGAEGVTVLLVEQNVARTAALADRTYVLRTGRIVLAGTRAELERARAAR